MTSSTDSKLTPLERVLARITPEMQHRVDNRMMLAARIADAMEEKGISQTQLAKQLGKPPSMITQWLSGTQNFTMDTLSDIESALGITLFQFVEPQPIVNSYFLTMPQRVQNTPVKTGHLSDYACRTTSSSFSVSTSKKAQA